MPNIRPEFIKFSEKVIEENKTLIKRLGSVNYEKH